MFARTVSLLGVLFALAGKLIGVVPSHEHGRFDITARDTIRLPFFARPCLHQGLVIRFA